MPHSTVINNKTDKVVDIDVLLDKAAHLIREQTLLMKDLEGFKDKLEKIEKRKKSRLLYLLIRK